MSRPVESFYPYIASIVEGAPQFLMKQQLLATAADLCQQTGCLSMDVKFKGKAGKADYVIPIPNDLEVETIRYVYVDGREVYPAHMDDLARAYVGKDWTEVTGHPMGYVIKKKGMVTLVPVPEVDCDIRLVAYASIVRTANTLPDEFFYDYLDVLVEGTLSRIYRVAGQVFTNSQMAAMCAARYTQMLTDIKNEAFRDFTRDAGRVNFNRII